MSDFRPDTRREGVTYLGSPAQSCRGEGGAPQTNVTGACGARAVSGPRWVCLHSRRVRFPGLRCSGSRLLCRTCLKRALGCVHFPGLGCSGPGSRVVHRGTDGWAWVLCPSQVRAAPATGCLASALSPGGRCVLPPPRPGLGFLGAQREHRLRCTVCLLWGADLWLRPSWRMSAVQDPRKTWLAAGSLLAVW